jgi:hypothetical protein
MQAQRLGLRMSQQYAPDSKGSNILILGCNTHHRAAKAASRSAGCTLFPKPQSSELHSLNCTQNAGRDCMHPAPYACFTITCSLQVQQCMLSQPWRNAG